MLDDKVYKLYFIWALEQVGGISRQSVLSARLTDEDKCPWMLSDMLQVLCCLPGRALSTIQYTLHTPCIVPVCAIKLFTEGMQWENASYIL